MNRTVMAVAGVSLLAVVGSAQAGVFSVSQTELFGPATPNFTQTLTFNQFDTNGGLFVLKSIQITANLNISGGLLELDNDGEDPASGSATLGATLQLVSSDVSLVNLTLDPVIGILQAATMSVFNLGGTVGDPVGEFNNTGDVDYFAFAGEDVGSGASDFVNMLVWAGYIGNGTFDIDAVVNQVFDFGSIGGISFAGSPVTASGDITVTFEYNLIPAPGAIAFMALAGLVGTRRRRA